MPVEIKELVIRAIADSPDGGRAEGEEGGAPGAAAAAIDQDAIVEAAVREVLRILKQSRWR